MRAVFAFLACSLVAAGASAISFVMLQDEALVDQAAAVIEVTVLSRDFSPAGGVPATDYLVEVDRVVAGMVPGGTLVVRVPGGSRPDGRSLLLYGVPRFSAGDRALLFLSPNRDGTFRIVHLMLGAFYEVVHGGERLLVRNFAGAHEVLRTGAPPDAEPAPAHHVRRYEGFTAWVADRARGQVRSPDYFTSIREADLAPHLEQFRFFTEGGRRLRWFDFDAGSTIPFRVSSRAQPGLTPDQVATATRAAINAWNGVSNARIRYGFAGTTAATGGLTDPDDVNSILFEDPNGNSIFGGAFSCTSGGVLAIGGPWFDSSLTGIFRGEPHLRILEADVVTNKGIGCFFTGSVNRQAAANELFTHELGHTLGIAHSSEQEGEPNALLREAVMYFLIKDDGRGAVLNNDDRGAARTLYGTGTGGGGAVPAAPSELAATVLSAQQVRLDWRDNADNENGFRIEQRSVTGSFSPIPGNFGPNTQSALVSNLVPATTYTFRVRAFNGDGSSAFSNSVTVTTPTVAPAAPEGLTAVPASTTQVLLRWRDRSTNETQFVVQMRSPTNEYQNVAVLGPGAQEATISGLEPGTPHTFRVRAANGSGNSPFSDEASATTLGPTGPCVPGDRSLCLLGRRFEVRVQFRDQINGGVSGIGQALSIPGSDQSGMFWFFGADSIELLVKMIDGQGLNGFFWTFQGGLSTIEYWISVRDTATGEVATYRNPPEELCGSADVRSFPRGEALAGGAPLQGPTARPVGAQALPWAAAIPAAGTSGGTCTPGPQTLCLLENRLRVEVHWENPRAPFNNGVGTVASVATVSGDETGFFWFFDSQSIELVVKALDAQVINGNFWVFYGALTDVGYTLTVTDTVTGRSRTFVNDPFNLCGDADLTTLVQ